jgi:hypothetical protein
MDLLANSAIADEHPIHPAVGRTLRDRWKLLDEPREILPIINQPKRRSDEAGLVIPGEHAGRLVHKDNAGTYRGDRIGLYHDDPDF